MRIYLQRQRFFFWKGWGSAGRPECAGLAELLEEVAYFSGFQENGLMRCSPFFGLFFRSFSFWLYVLSSVFCLLESFFSICVFLSAFLSFNFDYLAFGVVLFSFFLLVFTAYFLPTPPSTPVYLYFPLGSFLSFCHLYCFPFVCFFLLSLFLSFVFSFFLPSSFSVFPSRLVLYFFFPVFSLLFPFLLFSTPFPGPLTFPLFFSARGLPTAPRGRSLPLAGRPRRALLERRRQPEPASGENGRARLGMTGDPGPSP